MLRCCQAQRLEDQRLKDNIMKDLEGQLSGLGPDQLPPRSESKGEDDEEGESESGEDSLADAKSPNVDAAITALKAAKNEKRGKKIRKKIVKEKGAATKAKTKKGAQASAGKEKVEIAKATKGLEECDEFDVNITTIKGGDSRIKHALDDFLCTLHFVRSNLASAISNEEASRSKRFLLSLFLELSWGCSVAANGKGFKTYSSFRDEAHAIFYAAHRKLTMGQQSYDAIKLAQDLLAMVKGPASWLTVS